MEAAKGRTMTDTMGSFWYLKDGNSCGSRLKPRLQNFWNSDHGKRVAIKRVATRPYISLTLRGNSRNLNAE